MKKALFATTGLLALSILLPTSASAATRVRGYYNRSRNTYVQPHYRSSADSSRYNNYSTRGNINPYTGKKGYTSPYRTSTYHQKAYRLYR